MDWSYRIKEADKFFTYDSKYQWNGEFIRHAHQWCLAEAIRHLFIIDDDLVIVSNTFTRISEMQPYIVLAEQHNLQLEVVEPTTSWAKDPEECFRRNTHNVPLETIQRMLNRWEIIK